MKININFFQVILIAVAVLFVAGCASSHYKQGNYLYDKMAYAEAVKEFTKALGAKNIPEAKIKIADAYRKMNNAKKAESWYEQVVQMPQAQPVHKLYYAHMLKRNGKHDEARTWYNNYLESMPNDAEAKMALRSLDYIDILKRDSLKYIIELMSINPSATVSSFSPTFYSEGIVFTSDRNPQNKKRLYEWTGKPFLDLYYSKKENNSWSQPVALKGDLNGIYHEGPASFSPDGNVIYFTRNNYLKRTSKENDENIVHLRIFEAYNKNGEWVDIKEFPLNSINYSVGHPTISSDGNLMYFISDMPGGYGGTDVYFVKKEGAAWSQPINLGPEINTPSNEMFPYIMNDSILYFASEGHINMGGLDIFTSVKRGNKWTSVENIGYPINSEGDDFGLIMEKDNIKGYFTSNRGSDGEVDQIYSLEKNDVRLILDGLAINKFTRKPMGGVSIELLNKLTNQKELTTTIPDGKFTFKLDHNTEYIVAGSYPQYFTATKLITTFNRQLMGKIPVTLELEEIVVDKPIVLDNIYYDLNKWFIRPDAATELDKLVTILEENPNISIELSSHTDARASDHYNMILSQKRADAAVAYIISKGITKDRITAKGYGETKLINDCGNNVKCAEEKHQANRRTEFKVTKIN